MTITPKLPEPFEEPAAPNLTTLTDGREPGAFPSAYPRQAWVQIVIELAYLIIVLIASLVILFLLARMVLIRQSPEFITSLFGSYPENKHLLAWAAAALGGFCGGCAASLKWLYHTVAKQRWHRDRIIWRLVVPILSAVLSTFLGLLVYSGIVPILSKSPLSNPAGAAAFGFLVGFFSDNVLAGLQRFALSTFGTVDKSSIHPHGSSETRAE